MKQHLRTFANWKLNESYEMGATPESGNIIKRLIAEVDKAVNADDWREANRTLREFIESNERELAQADGTEVITALEPWYDTYKDDWKADAEEFQEDDPLAGDIEDEGSFNFNDEEEAPSGEDENELDLDAEEDDWD